MLQDLAKIYVTYCIKRGVFLGGGTYQKGGFGGGQREKVPRGNEQGGPVRVSD